MKRYLLCTLACLALSAAQATEPAEQRELPGKRVETKDVPIEELAHYYFWHDPEALMLTQLISKDGVARVREELEGHKRYMIEDQELLHIGQKLCRELRNARHGPEFAAILAENDAREHARMRQAAKRIMDTLEPSDRKILVDYLDTEFRERVQVGRLDFEKMFSRAPFPSPQSNGVVRRVCDSVSELEKRVQP